ncbi:MAG: DUF1543 domain-containing protein [Synechococcaceae cyanobacterium]|nr:DUF1543 domain-containing protein [Synechococcaceae cyanobacterium]
MAEPAASPAGSSPPEEAAVAPTLFLVVLGGRCPGGHIEQHDVRFVAGRTIEETLPELRRQWIGRRQGLHLDAYMAVQAVDGWRVELSRVPAPQGPERLWFVNLGAYRPDSLAELHHFGLVVATSAPAARAAAKRRWLTGLQQQHRDDLWEVDDCLALGQLALLDGVRWHLRLTPHPAGLAPAQVPDWFGYRPI